MVGPPFLVTFLFMICLIMIPLAVAETRHYTWEVTYQYKYLDCHRKLAITINGLTPGPNISAVQGDKIIVNVINGLVMENVAIHWHGIQQRGTPWSDGTDGVTQCPIVPGENYTYEFVVDKAGSYMCHSHYGMQREAGLYGLIIVSLPAGESEPFSYDHDHGIVLSDWYHHSAYDHATRLSSKPFEWIGEPQSLLINGRGKYDCTGIHSSVCNSSLPQCSPFALTVIPGITYRLRIASLTSLSALSFQIEDHMMKVVEADGNYVEPFLVENLYIYSGETYSVLVTADKDSTRNYWMSLNVVSREPNTTNALAILKYDDPNHPHEFTPSTNPPPGPRWDDNKSRIEQSSAIKALQGHFQTPPENSDKEIILLNTQNTINGYTKWALNNVSFALPNTPYLIALKGNIRDAFDPTPPPETYDTENYDIYSVANNTNAISRTGIYKLEFGSTVDIILQNSNTMKNETSETHPWHLHGHDFWVLGYGEGKFNLKTDVNKYNLVNPIMKNTVPLHPYGWTALRFKADNPGVWLFHCHIEAHFFMGMFVVFEAGVEKVGDMPKSSLGCGKSKYLIAP
ncbi:hypothetical protein SLA2020_179070 [Shorea laevis]